MNARWIFWDFKRASWQYDVVVALILAFIFLVPRDIFEDQPKAASISMLPAGHSFWLEPDLLREVPQEQRATVATSLVQKRFKTPVVVHHVEAFYDADKQLTGYMAVTTP